MRWRAVFLASGFIVLLAIGGGRGSNATAGVPACTLSWSVVPSAPITSGELFAVAASTPDDAWAVGGPSDWGSGPPPTALTEHWDGTQWSVVASPEVTGVLEGVAVAAHDDVWAVGELGSFTSATDEGPGTGALAEHWDGSQWTQVTVAGARRLSAVAATSGRDVWAVGSDATRAAIVLHWTGSRWTRVARRPKAELFDVVAISPHDVWAVGDETDRRFLELHWDGKRWSSYTQLPPNGGFGLDDSPEMATVAATGPNDVWAAGDAGNSGGPAWADTVVLHWNGVTWRHVSTRMETWVDALAIPAPADVLLAGLSSDIDGYVQAGEGPVVQRLLGNRWQKTWLENGERFDGLAGDRAGGVWAVGYTGSGFDEDNGFPAQTASLIARGTCS
jgi:hypothetical protein